MYQCSTKIRGSGAVGDFVHLDLYPELHTRCSMSSIKATEFHKPSGLWIKAIQSQRNLPDRVSVQDI